MKSQKPKIAIFMSCYNHEKYVGEAMDSILGQTYENWELFVANDGSSDKTGEILAAYEDHRVHFYDFKENKHYVGAMNFLFERCYEAEADYVAGMSSDDMWETNKLEKQIAFLNEHPEYKACFTWDKVIFSSDHKGVYAFGMYYSHMNNRSRFEWLNQFCLCGNCINGCSFLMDKDVFYELDRMNLYYRSLGDLRLWIKLAEKYPFYLMKEELTYYRRHETNLSEPSIETDMRNANEEYQILRDVIISMDKFTFRRTFYRHLPYMECDSQEELLAEKFIFLVSANTVKTHQIALDIFFMNCSNKEWIRILEERYYFYAKDFFVMTGKSGLQARWAGVQQMGNRFAFSPAVVLMNEVDQKRIEFQNLDRYRYSMLYDLCLITSENENGKAQYEKIKKYVLCLQQMRALSKTDKKRELFLIAGHTEWDFSAAMQDCLDQGKECFAAFVLPTEEAMAGECLDIAEERIPDGAEILKLYDEEDHSLHFLYENSIDVDCIWYVDCLGEEYECGMMAAGYSLAVEYHAVLRKEIYQRMLKNEREEAVLALMSKIQIYGEEV